MINRLYDKVAVVTGAGKGIGRVLAQGLAEEGARVAIPDIDEVSAMKAAEELTRAGHNAIGIYTDVSNMVDTQRMVKTVLDAWGRIDVLVNNAAIQNAKAWDEWTPEEFDRFMAINVKGAWLCCRAVIPIMITQGKGKVINIGSETWIYGSPGLVPYVASKAGLVGLTRAMAREVGPLGVRINCLSPGLTMTETALDEINKHIRPGRVNELVDEHVEGQCIRHPGYPEDLIGPVVFLASDDSDFVTGQHILVNGGWVFA